MVRLPAPACLFKHPQEPSARSSYLFKTFWGHGAGPWPILTPQARPEGERTRADTCDPSRELHGQLEALIPTWAPLLARDQPGQPRLPWPAASLQAAETLLPNVGQKWCADFWFQKTFPRSPLLPPNPQRWALC